MNFESGCSRSSVPVISHESAQFQSYPDFSEISKYTGVLEPANMEIFKKRLADAGMAAQAQAFHEASGKWAVELYKQEIEMNLRTPSMAGFQLLDIQDYPGQGSAYVGILDAFMDNKGFVTPDEWRGWCSDVVPMLSSDKYCYTSGERLKAHIQLANYSGKSLGGKNITWKFGDKSGKIRIPEGEGLLNAGDIDIDLSHIHKPIQLQLTLSVDDNPFFNRYNIWVYPDNVDFDELERQVIVTSGYNKEIAAKLNDGATVVLGIADAENSVGALFQTDYWNFRMFKTICENNGRDVSPGTLGILTDPSHPIFAEFPTDMHSDWQWFQILKHSRPLVLDNLDKGYRPVVQVIDNIERNHRLGLVSEFSVGKGKLLVVASDLEKIKETPEGRSFYASVVKYAQSRHFQPEFQITSDQFGQLLDSATRAAELQKLNNISPY